MRWGSLVVVLSLGVAGSTFAAGVASVYAQPVQPVAAPNAPVPLQPVSVAPTPIPGQAAPGTPPTGVSPALPAGDGAMTALEAPYSYNPSGRRDPFAAIVLEGPKLGPENMNLPPLQRTSLTELTLIGIIWGGFGYTAMVQTADGKGYTVRQGTKIGPNNGVVSVITENSVVVQERFIDVYGKKQVREYVKLLHQKENTE